MKVLILRRKIEQIPLLEVVLENNRHLPLPTIFFYHGWRSKKELVLTQARRLAKAGFRVICPDALNHGERKQPVSPIPSFTFWQSIQGNVAEFSFLVDDLTKKGLILPEEIGVGGVSMGGFTTCMLLTQHPEIKAATCLMGSPAPLSYRQRVFDFATQQGAFIPSDFFYLTDWIPHYDLSFHPEKVANRPLFIWHGTKDWKVPYEPTSKFYQEIQEKSYGNHVYFETGVDKDHLVEIPLMEKVTQFFEYFLLEKK